jgi:hypothetical protein
MTANPEAPQEPTRPDEIEPPRPEPLEPEPVDDPRLEPETDPDDGQDPGDVQAG